MSRRATSKVRRDKRRRLAAARASNLIGRLRQLEVAELDPRDFPPIERALDCALPALGFSEEHARFPQVLGTCFAVRYRSITLLLTAKHVVDLATTLLGDAGRLVVPRGFDRSLVFEAGTNVISPEGVVRANAARGYEDEPSLDLAALPLPRETTFCPDVLPLDLVGSRDQTSSAPRRCLRSPGTRLRRK